MNSPPQLAKLAQPQRVTRWTKQKPPHGLLNSCGGLALQRERRLAPAEGTNNRNQSSKNSSVHGCTISMVNTRKSTQSRSHHSYANPSTKRSILVNFKIRIAPCSCIRRSEHNLNKLILDPIVTNNRLI